MLRHPHLSGARPAQAQRQPGSGSGAPGPRLEAGGEQEGGGSACASLTGSSRQHPLRQQILLGAVGDPQGQRSACPRRHQVDRRGRARPGGGAGLGAGLGLRCAAAARPAPPPSGSAGLGDGPACLGGALELRGAEGVDGAGPVVFVVPGARRGGRCFRHWEAVCVCGSIHKACFC